MRNLKSTLKGEVMKQFVLFFLLASASMMLAQDSGAAKSTTPDNSKPASGQITVQGCVSRLNGDFTLVRADPGMTYELHATGKTKLSRYLGQQVEVTGKQSPSMRTSSDTLEGRSPAPVTLTITSIKTIAKECTN
jgi:hypothetical protein